MSPIRKRAFIATVAAVVLMGFSHCVNAALAFSIGSTDTSTPTAALHGLRG